MVTVRDRSTDKNLIPGGRMSVWTCSYCKVYDPKFGPAYGISFCGVEPETENLFKKHLETCAYRPNIVINQETATAKRIAELEARVSELESSEAVSRSWMEVENRIISKILEQIAAVAQSVERLPCKQGSLVRIQSAAPASASRKKGIEPLRKSWIGRSRAKRKAQRDPVPDTTSWGQSSTAHFTGVPVSARPEKIEDKPNEYFWPFGVWK
jgi:hypothetical protein